MNAENETIADIVESMRNGTIPKHRTDHELLTLYADRLDAALKRERELLRKTEQLGNAAVISEALDRIGNTALFVSENCGNKETAKYMNYIIMDVQAAVYALSRKGDNDGSK